MTLSSLILPTLLVGARAALAALDPIPSLSNTPCDDGCLLKLIRYREEANVDWLMAVPFCSSFLVNPAEQRTRVQLIQVATSLPAAASDTATTTITSTLTTTSTGFLTEPTTLDDLGDSSISDTSSQPLVNPRHHIHAQDSGHVAICNRYWAHYKPRPLPWLGQPTQMLRLACSRLLHRAPVFEFSSEEAAMRVVLVAVAAPVEEQAEMVSVTVYKTITTEVLVEPPVSTSTMTVTSTMTRTVTVFEEGDGVAVTAGPVGVEGAAVI